MLPSGAGGNPVESIPAPRMAAHDAEACQCDAFKKSMLLKGSNGVLRTGRIIAAGAFATAEESFHGRDGPLVEADAQDTQLLHFVAGSRSITECLFLFISTDYQLCLLVKVVLQDDAGRSLIDDSAAVANRLARFMQ